MIDLRPSENLTSIMREEEERILRSLPGERRWGLLELVRAIDYYFVYVLGLDENRISEGIRADIEHTESGKRWNDTKVGNGLRLPSAHWKPRDSVVSQAAQPHL